jgi:hypothetical protein
MPQFDSFAYSVLTMVIFGGFVVGVLSFFDRPRESKVREANWDPHNGLLFFQNVWNKKQHPERTRDSI